MGIFGVPGLKPIPPVSFHFPFPRIVNEFFDDGIASHTLVATDTNFTKFPQTFPTERNPAPINSSVFGLLGKEDNVMRTEQRRPFRLMFFQLILRDPKIRFPLTVEITKGPSGFIRVNGSTVLIN